MREYDDSIGTLEAIKRFSEGRLSKYEVSPLISPSTFIRMIVLDVVSDANADMFNEDKKVAWNDLGVINMNYSNSLPRNTIIARRVGEDSSPMFVFPFFPSHLSLPCKPGEMVWAMLENPENSNSDIAWWFGKIQTGHMSDDVNHTHPGRTFEYSLTPNTLGRAASSSPGDSAWHELRNGPVFEEDGSRYTDAENQILKNEPDDVFERLVTSSNASDLIAYEVVPRFKKRPSDVVLEGSNNSLIVLGNDRTGPLEKTKFKNYASSIDLVVGRGQTEETFGKTASTTSISDADGQTKGSEIKKELNKVSDALSPKEGDVDLKNDRSRILISQRTSVDDNFGLKEYNKSFSVNDSEEGDSSIVIKADKLRLIARSDVEILVTGFDSATSPSGISRKDESSDTKKWASIVIKSNGDIVFNPADKGVIKLGGDDANLAVLCEKATTGAGDSSGLVTCASGIMDTMGGIQGASPEGGTGYGTFAKKVLMK